MVNGQYPDNHMAKQTDMDGEQVEEPETLGFHEMGLDDRILKVCSK